MHHLIDTMTSLISLYNKDKRVVGQAKISAIDYENISRYTWHMKTVSDSLSYAFTNVNGQKTAMHHLIIGKPSQGYVVDHLNHDGLDNTRANLRFATYTQNSQNTKKMESTSSKYKGVHWDNRKKKWISKYFGAYSKSFADEIDAARFYDTYVLLALGKDAKTNGLVKYNDIENMTISEFIKPSERTLPKYISFNAQRNMYEVQIYYKNKYTSRHRTLDGALKQLHDYQQIISQQRAYEKTEHHKQPITRNANGLAVIPIHNKAGQTIDEVIVDDGVWHELMLHSWAKHNDKHFKAWIDGKKVSMHRFLMKAQPGQIVDHVNDGSHINSNLMSNLRFNSASGNSHNRIKKNKTSSKYIGVSLYQGRWKACISKDGTQYYLGLFDKEVDAAMAYNKKAVELYNENANLNDI